MLTFPAYPPIPLWEVPVLMPYHSSVDAGKKSRNTFQAIEKHTGRYGQHQEYF
jgi:hypothetical protein